jgi:hypothetical protein
MNLAIFTFASGILSEIKKALLRCLKIDNEKICEAPGCAQTTLSASQSMQLL